jgi:hypothetical protein
MTLNWFCIWKSERKPEADNTNFRNITACNNDDQKQGLTVEDYRNMWQFFEERGALDKERLVAIVTWLLAFTAVIIGYIATQQLLYRPICTKDPVATALFAIVGIFVCHLARKITYEFARHARSNFIKADYCAAKIPNMEKTFFRRVPEHDLDNTFAVKDKVDNCIVLARAGSIFRNFVNMANCSTVILLILLGFGGATVFGFVNQCTQEPAAARASTHSPPPDATKELSAGDCCAHHGEVLSQQMDAFERTARLQGRWTDELVRSHKEAVETYMAAAEACGSGLGKGVTIRAQFEPVPVINVHAGGP